MLVSRITICSSTLGSMFCIVYTMKPMI